MTSATQGTTIPKGQDEKSEKIMVYTSTSLYWGEVVVKEVIRVSTWLRTNAAPDRITLYNASGIIATTAVNTKPLKFGELNIPLSQIYAYHLMPPARDPLDFDPTEPNRRMESVTALVSTFIIKGSLRLSTNSDLKKYLEVTRESFTAIYDAEITNGVIPSLGPITVPFVLVRQDTTTFAKR
ncbi:hypothetical protein ATHL_01363 [Anaerolinea thermolimosa]|uniref:hypothetical protein n=1 Tax=Anaerolinea thermolimosa TaxID=229919 RepID=UPI0007845AA2|nr:hypothetical protein [Anaerolinea thermolimosa]GAP06509.1 hypothetical protein ATHL_01363 [Anaerolinea thermolimosa]